MPFDVREGAELLHVGMQIVRNNRIAAKDD